MTNIVPSTRPEMGRHAAEALLAELRVDLTKPALLGRRGYYRDSMGAVGVNEFGLYDDAIMLVTPTAYVTYNANTDPSTHHPGVAVLKAGVWRYRLGIHNLSKDPAVHPHYEALVQAAPVTVTRDPGGAHATPWDDTGLFGINIHHGGFNTTSSEGCQTIHPDQWAGFITLVKSEVQRYGVIEIPYALTERGPVVDVAGVAGVAGVAHAA